MNKRFCAVLTLICVLWQTFAGLQPFTVGEQATEISHAVVHSRNTNHHHHGDRSLHMDEPGVQVAHQHTDSASTLVGMLPTPGRLVVVTQASNPVAAPSLEHPTALVDRLLRPPNFLS